MSVEVITRAIEAEASHISNINPFFTRAAGGMLTKAEVSTYLYNVKYLIEHTVPCLMKAEARARELGRAPLADFFKNKIDEERGHEAWAEDDLAQVLDDPSENQSLAISSKMKALTTYIQNLIDQDPEFYLLYMFYAEYFTVLTAPTFLENLERLCKIPKANMSVIAKHEELDREHVKDDIDILKLYLKENHSENVYLDVVQKTSSHIDQFLLDVVRSH